MGDPQPSPHSPRRPAVFLDRDGTLIADRHYLADPDDVALLADAASAVARLNAAGVPVIVVTNQSGIGRGYYTKADYDLVATRLAEALAAHHAHLDATYLCPHAPSDETPCACRKPGLLLFERAIADHALDAKRSFFIGDRWRDVVPARAFGGRGILVPGPDTPQADRDLAAREAEIAPSLGAAVDRVLAVVAAGAA